MIRIFNFRWLFILPAILLLANSAFAIVPDSASANQVKYPDNFFSTPSIEGTTICRLLTTEYGNSDLRIADPSDPGHTKSLWVGILKGTINGVESKFYCIDLLHDAKFYKLSQPHEYTDSDVSSPAITYIANNFYPYKPLGGSSLSTPQKEAAAVQLAIWHFSDNVDLNTITHKNNPQLAAEIKARAIVIRDLAVANGGDEVPPFTISIIPASQSVASGAPAKFKVLVLDNEGNGVSGINVSLSVSSGTLSSSSTATGANGLTPEVSLTQGSSANVTITASASAVLPNGNRFVHTVTPDECQKLVLVTPTLITRTATSSITWYVTNGPCDVNGFTTFTQGGWGGPSNSGPGKIRDLYFDAVFPNGVVVGVGKTLTLTSAHAVKDFLPAGGTSSKFTKDYEDPEETSAGVLAGQLVALTMNIYYDAAGKIGSNSTNLGDLIIKSGTFQGKSVNQFLTIANQAIGGAATGYTYSQINDMATAINENFDNGSVNNGTLTCGFTPSSLGDKIWLDVNKNGIQDAGEAGITNMTVELYNCGNTLLSTKITDANGNYLFDNLDAGSYYIKVVLPAGYAFSPKDQGDNQSDSDIDPIDGKTTCIDLSWGTNDLSWDAGLYSTEAPCATDWSATMGPDITTICEYDPVAIPVTVNINLTPNPGKARVQTSWRIVHPGTGSDYNYNSFLIEGNTEFVITAMWPGINSGDELVELEYSVNILNCAGSPIHAAVTKVISWNPTVCAPPAPNEADIEVIKTVDNATPLNNEIIKYSILVKNNGPKDATNVQVSDILPAGLVFSQDPTVSVGSYNKDNGVWTVGDLPNGQSRTMSIYAKVNVTFANESIIDLGVAKDYNLFVIDDLFQPSSDTEGKVAVGGSADLANYSVGYSYPNSHGTEDVLVVGGNLTYRTGAIYSGNVVYGNSTNLPINQTSIIDGEERQDANLIHFDEAEAYLTSLSTQLGEYEPNGTVTFEWGSLNCSGSSPVLNVFEVSGADLTLANNLHINAPNGSVVVVNIYGTSPQWTGGLVVTGTNKRNVLFNFPEATSIKIQNIDVTGSILAPFAHVNFVTGVQNGQMICKSLAGQGQFNIAPFIGNVPVDVNIVNVAEVINSAPLDPVVTNNSSFASININPRENGTGGGGTGVGSGNWQLAGNFAEGQMVWTITKDNANNLLAGTMGGKIYRSNDGGLNWTTINTGMSVGFVWSIVVNSSGDIFAGTEFGIYKSADNGATWNLSALSGHDTRALLIDNSGSLYAGTWDSGIWKSTDNGANWMQINTGLTALAVHALAVDSQNKIYAGTYGAGVFKSVDAGSNWVRTQSPYNFIWTIKVVSDDNIFAGTYGGGVFRTTNGGDFWLEMNNGLTSDFIYSITADNQNNLFVNTWNSGVFASANSGLTWESLGMSGFGVSSIYSNSGQTEASGATLVAGTSDGAIYINTAPLVSVKEIGSDLPTTYSVSQNYPNPFNPTTMINFAIPVKAMVTLKIFNILGQEVRTLINGELEQGKYKISFDAKGLASGVYIYQLNSNSFSVSKKMILQK